MCGTYKDLEEGVDGGLGVLPHLQVAVVGLLLVG